MNPSPEPKAVPIPSAARLARTSAALKLRTALLSQQLDTLALSPLARWVARGSK